MFRNYFFSKPRYPRLKMILALMAGIILLSSCSTTTPKTDTSGLHVASSGTSAPSRFSEEHQSVITPATNFDVKPGEDDIAQWAEERAQYLRSLDFSEIDQQNLSPAVNNYKSNLINTRYYLDYAERLLFNDGDVAGAKNEIRHAVNAYKSALALSENKNTEEMSTIKSELRNLFENTHRVQPRYCNFPPRYKFNIVEQQIEDLLAKT